MSVGDKVIYFKAGKHCMGTYTKIEAEIVKVLKTQAWIMFANGEKKRVYLENLQRAK